MALYYFVTRGAGAPAQLLWTQQLLSEETFRPELVLTREDRLAPRFT